MTAKIYWNLGQKSEEEMKELLSNKNNIMKRKICSECGSDNVLADAYARWNSEKNDWELDSTFDSYYCNECEGECSVEDVEIEKN